MDDFALELALLPYFFKALLRDVLSVVNELDAVLELDDSAHIKALSWVLLEALHDDLVDHAVNRFLRLVKAQFCNIHLGFLDTCAFEGVHLGHEVKEAAAQRPCLGLLREVAIARVVVCGVERELVWFLELFGNDLGRAVVDVARVVGALEEFFKVVGQADQVEFAEPVVVVDSGWVHVAVDDAQRVHVSHAGGQLPKDAKQLLS